MQKFQCLHQFKNAHIVALKISYMMEQIKNHYSIKPNYFVLHTLLLVCNLYLKNPINKTSIFNQHLLTYELVINFI